MGSDSFSIPQLSRLLDMKNIDIISVYTKSPKEQKRGKKILPNDLDIFATQNNILVYHCDSLKDYIFDSETEKNIDLIIVSAYGVILPKYVLEYPKYGCINVHPSLLPRWRGASPIQSTILNGDSNTAVSIIKLVAELDAGDIIITEKIDLNMQENYQTLKLQLGNIAEDLLCTILNNSKDLEECLNNSTKQIGEVVFCTKLHKEEINWNESIVIIDRKIRAFCGMNCRIFIRGSNYEMNVKLHEIRYIKSEHTKEIGTAVLENNEILIYAIDGYIIPERIQPISGKIMTMKEFITGYGRKFC